MKSIFILLISYLFSFLQINTYHVNYQAHGFNDLDYFIQLLKKGVNIYKFDINLSNLQSCQEQTSWKGNPLECEKIPMYGFKTCCLVFRGDESTAPIWDYPTNTTDDFVNIFNSGEYDYILSKEKALPRYNETKLIAINFQYGPYTMNNLTKNFMFNWFKAINDRNLNVKVIFGREKFITDYDSKCLKGECDFKDQYISDFDVILQSHDYILPKLPKKRTWHFNTNYVDLTRFCAMGFPPWVNENNPYPLIFWEPSHEEGMSWAFKKFFNGTCHKPASKKKKSDYQQANNQDPEMQEVYVQGVNATYSGQKNLFLNKTDTTLEYLEENDLYLMGYRNSKEQQTYLAVLDSKKTVIKEIQTVEVIEYLKIKQMETNPKDYIIMGISQTYLSFWKFNSKNNSITSFPSRPIPISLTLKADEKFLGADIYQENILSQRKNFDVLLTIGNTKENTLSVSKITIFEENSKLRMLKSIKATKLSSQNFNLSNKINVTKINYSDFALKNNKGLLLFNLEDQRSKMYAVFFEKASDDWNIEYGKSLNAAFGIRPVLKLYQDNKNNLYFLTVSTHGSSQSGVLFNNNNFNKCVYQNYPEFGQLLNLQYAMNYLYGKYDDLKSEVLNGQIVNSCSKKIMQGEFSNGLRPSAILKQSNIDAKDFFTAEVLYDYVDYFYLPSPTKFFAGSSGIYNKIEGFDLKPREIVENASMFTYFSLIDFEAFESF